MSQQTLHDPTAVSLEGGSPLRADDLRLARYRLRLTVAATVILTAAVCSAVAIVLGAGPGTFASSIGGIIPLPPIVLLAAGLLVGSWLTVRVARRMLDPQTHGSAQATSGNADDAAAPAALVDPLTGLGNHRAFQEEFDRQLDGVRRSNQALSLVLIDVDDFKAINEAAGHATGDQALTEVAKVLRSGLRRSDRIFRVGGDEFAVIMTGIRAEEAHTVARRILSTCLEPRRAAGFERGLSFSAGIASAPAMGVDRSELYGRADDALFQAKRDGRTAIRVYDPSSSDLPLSGDRLARAAHAVVDVVSGTAVSSVYQPIVDLRTGAVVGFEGLTRPDAGTAFEDPASMFSVAEASGRTADLDWLCARAILSGVAGKLQPHQVLSLNLSPMTVEAPEFQTQALLGILALAGISPDRFILEITERHPIDDLGTLRSKLDACRAAGMRVALDDVGTGNMGLRLLSQIQFDLIKLDLSAIQTSTQREASLDIFRTLLELSTRRGALAVAEGVETLDQLHMALDLGLERGQGFLLARPIDEPLMATIDLESILGEHGSSAMLRALAVAS